MSQTQEQKRKRKRKLKKKQRRKKDTVQMIPFIIAFQGDSAWHFRCAMLAFRSYFELNPLYKNSTDTQERLGFSRLQRFKAKIVQFISTKGIIHIKDAC